MNSQIDQISFWFQYTSFAASMVSLILGIVAIVLSILFYVMSTTAGKETTEAARNIGASVERLEMIFKSLYADTFSMMRDTFSEMQKHAWPSETPQEEAADIEEESETKADTKLIEMREELDTQLKKVLKQQEHTAIDMQRLHDDMRSLMNQAMTASRQVELEARKETIREHLLRLVRMYTRGNGRGLLASKAIERLKLTPDQLKEELDKLTLAGTIELDPPSPPEEFGPLTRIKMVILKDSARARMLEAARRLDAKASFRRNFIDKKMDSNTIAKKSED
jgi:hypothetical protein